MGTIWYLDPEGESCDQCADAAGWYDSRPPLPHDNCNCTIQEYELGEDDGSCKVELREVELSESSESDSLRFNAKWDLCGESADVELNSGDLSALFDEEVDQMPDQLREALKEQVGWNPPEPDVDVDDINVEGRTHGVITQTGAVYTAEASAEVWAVCESGGETYEEHLEDISGTYQCVYAVEVDRETEACDDWGN